MSIAKNKTKVIQFENEIEWEQASEQIYERLLSEREDHILYQIWIHLNLQKVIATCAAFHKAEGNGRPITNPVSKLVPMLILRYLYALSLRETEEWVNDHMMAKWFTGHHLFERAPDHTTLQRFEHWVSKHHPELFFDEVLAQITERWPHLKRKTQYADTFALVANAKLQGLRERMRHSSTYLQKGFEEEYPELYEQLDAKIWAEIVGYPAAVIDEEKAVQEQNRVALAQKVAELLQRVRDLLAQLETQNEIAPRTERWLNLLTKLVYDEFIIEETEGTITIIRVCKQKERGLFPMHTAVDPDATIRNHGRGKRDFGYNVGITACEDVIQATVTETGSVGDMEEVAPLIEKQRKRDGHCPEKLVFDTIAGSGKTAAAVATCSDGQTQLVAPPMPYSRNKTTYGPADCQVSEDGLILTCPQGRITGRRFRDENSDGWNYHFLHTDCTACPLVTPCRGTKKLTRKKRSFFISDHRAHYNALVAYSQTDSYAQEMGNRFQIERLISHLVNQQGCRRARFRGLKKVRFQVNMSAMALNLKKWMKREEKRTAVPADCDPNTSLPHDDSVRPTARSALGKTPATAMAVAPIPASMDPTA